MRDGDAPNNRAIGTNVVVWIVGLVIGALTTLAFADARFVTLRQYQTDQQRIERRLEQIDSKIDRLLDRP